MFKYICGHLEEMLGAAVIAVMVSLSFINVVTRYVIHYPFAFTEEITISMFVWITLLGASIAFRKNAHLAVTVFHDMAPVHIRKIFCYIANLTSIFFFTMLAWLGGRQVLDEWEVHATSDALNIPTWIYSGGVPVFSVLIIIRIIQSTRDQMRSGKY